MLRALLLLHSLMADHEALAAIADGAFRMALARLCVFACVSVRFVVREFLAVRRSKASSKI